MAYQSSFGSYAEGRSNSSSSGSSGGRGSYKSNFGNYAATRKKRDEENEANKLNIESLKQSQAKKEDDKKKEQQSKESILTRAKNVVKMGAEAITSDVSRITRGAGEAIYGGGEQKVIEESFNQRADTNKRAIEKANKKLADKNLTKDQRESWKKAKSLAEQDNKSIYKESNKITKEVKENADPVKGAAAVASLGFDIATAGTGGAAVKGTKLVGEQVAKKAGKEVIEQGVKQVGKKIAQGSFEGAVGGALGAVSQNGKDTTAWDIAKGGGFGAVLGGAIPTGGYLVSKSKAVTNEATQKLAKKIIDKTGKVDSVVLKQIGENGVVGAIDRMVSRTGSKLAYAGSDALSTTETGRAIISAKDKFMSKLVSAAHPLYKILKRSDFEGRTDGAYMEVREALGNSNRSLAEADDFINNNENIQDAIAGIASKKNDVIKSRAAFDEYSKARSELDLVKAGKKEYSKDKIEELKLRADAAEDYSAEYDKLVGAYKDLNEFRYKEGLISEADYKQFKDDPFDYVRVQREIPDWMLDKPQGVKNAGGSGASITKSGSIQKRNKYASAEQLSPLETLIKATQLAHVEAGRNKAAKTIKSVLEEAGEANVVRSTDIVREKEALLKNLKDSKPIVTQLNRTYRKQNKQLRKLQSELDRLNKEGMNLRLKDKTDKSMPNFTPGGMNGKVPTSKAGKYSGKGEKIDRPEFLKEGYQDPQKMVNDYADMLRDIEKGAKGGQMIDTTGVTDAYGSGKKRVSEHSPFYREYYAQNGKAPTKAAYREQALKDIESGKAPYGLSDEYKALVKDNKLRDDYNTIYDAKDAMNRPTWESKLGPKDSRAFLASLVSEDPAKIKKIRKMIEARNPKLAPLLDQVELMSRDLQDLHAQRSGVWNQAMSTKTTVDKSGMTSLSFLDDGVENVVKVDPVIASAVHDWGRQQTNVMNNVLRMTNNIFKYGTTTANVGFALPNWVADQVSSGINSKALFSTHNPINFVHSLFLTGGKPLSAQDAEILQAYVKANKGVTAINQYNKKTAAKREANKLITGNAKTSKKAYTLLKHPGTAFRELKDGVDSLIGATEEATRIQNFRGTYKKALKENMSKADATKVANLAARENSVDFLEMGDWGRVLNSIIPYFNAGIQGTRTMFRNAGQRPVSFAAKTTALIGMPVAATTIWNTGSEERKAIYDTIPEYVKESNLVVVGPGAKWNEEKNKWDGVYIMKKPPGYKEMAEPVRKFIEYKADNGDASMMDFFRDEGKKSIKDSASAISPINFSDPYKFLSSVTPQILKPTAEAILNKNFFTGEDIVGGSLANLPPEDQRRDNYSQLTAHIGGMFNTSPMKVDQWIKNTFGEGGTNVVNAIDRTSQGLGFNPEGNVGGRSLGETVKRRFVGAPGGADADAFYKEYKPILSRRTKLSAEVTDLIKQGRRKEAARKANEWNNSLTGTFSNFNERFGNSPTYDSGWDDRMKSLFIKTSDRSFDARDRN